MVFLSGAVIRLYRFVVPAYYIPARMKNAAWKRTKKISAEKRPRVLPEASGLAQMIDCHTHLTDDAFAKDREAVLRRAHRAGVRAIAIVGQDLAENRAVLAAAKEARETQETQKTPRPPSSGAGGNSGAEAQPGPLPSQLPSLLPSLLPFLGLHPDRFADSKAPFPASETAAIVALIREHAEDIVGIGEVGLDYWVCQDEERRAAQREALSTLSALAMELGLPLNVHSRSAGRHTLELLMEQGNAKVLMHAFDGKAGHALKGAEAGYLFSIPPSIVRSPQKVKLARLLPLESLALETDSPVLGPVAGERNEPANAAISAAAIAEIKGLPEAQVRETCMENARRLFGLDEET